MRRGMKGGGAADDTVTNGPFVVYLKRACKSYLVALKAATHLLRQMK